MAHMNATVGRGCVRKRFGSAMRGFSFTLPTNTSGVSQKAVIQALSKRSEVGYVFQDYVIKAVGNPGEPQLAAASCLATRSSCAARDPNTHVQQ